MIDFSRIPPLTPDALAEHAYLMQTIGYNLVADFYSEEICDMLRERLQRAVDEYVPYGSEQSVKDRYNLHSLMCDDIVFAKTLEDPRLQQLVAAVLGGHWIMYAYTSSSLPPRGNNYGSRVHVDSPRLIPGYPTNVGVLWALDDFTLENGCTKVLPASHHSSEVPTEEFFERHASQVLCRKGSVLVFNARVWHRAGENNTDQWRHSLTMNACRPFMKQRMDWVRYVPTEIADRLDQQARRIIGYDTRLPSSLEEFFVGDGERLYKPNQE